MEDASLFAAGPVAQIVLDNKFLVQRVNRAWSVHTGTNPSNRPWLEAVHPDERDNHAALLGKLRTGGPGHRLASRLPASAGGWFHATLEATPVGNSILITMLPAAPVDPRLIEEHHILASALSHDLRQHARLVSSYLSLLLRSQLTGIDNERLHVASHEADRLSAMLTGLVHWLRLNDRPIVRAPCDIDAIVTSIAKALPGLVVEPSPLPVLDGDPTLIEELLQAILTNAVHYASSPVNISATRTGAYWELTIADHGPGIPPDERIRIVRPLRRLHTWEQVPGHGLGLAIAERIASRHGGGLAIDTSPTGGCLVRVRLLA